MITFGHAPTQYGNTSWLLTSYLLLMHIKTEATGRNLSADVASVLYGQLIVSLSF